MLSHRALVAYCLFFTGLTVNPVCSQPVNPKEGPLGMKFVPLPKATFYIGWDGTKGSAKKTEIKEDFEIAIHTVTQGQWKAVMGNDPSWFSRNGNGKGNLKDLKDEDLKQFPVETVSWNDVQEFIKKLNEKEKGFQYRLPSEVEWEYACRGGATSEEECSYHFYIAKPTNDLSSKEANFNGNYPFGKAVKGPNLGRTTKVGSYAPNKLGLFDMHGNIWQLCEDIWETKPPNRVMRGGFWFCGSGREGGLRAADRDCVAPDDRLAFIGFRVVRVAVR